MAGNKDGSFKGKVALVTGGGSGMRQRWRLPVRAGAHTLNRPERLSHSPTTPGARAGPDPAVRARLQTVVACPTHG
jgi:NAD(P)-dependent dehydrogenase (short-subunit alcohol dehydrogenase family)